MSNTQQSFITQLEIQLVMQVIVRSGSGAYPILIDNDTTVDILKIKIFEKCGIPVESQVLRSNNIDLKEGVLSENKIRDKDVIDLWVGLKGGGGGISFSGSEFNSLSSNNKITKNFSQKARKYRLVGRGLNLEGTCMNNGCAAYGKRVIVPKKFGEFHINYQICSSPCPLCNENCKDVSNIYYHQCHLIIDGRINELGTYHAEDTLRSEDETRTFASDPENLRSWIYLKIVAKQLQA